MKRKSGPPIPIRGLLETVVPRLDRGDRLRVYRVWRFWAEEVGETVARHAAPLRFHSGVLSVRVTNHTWIQELQFLKPRIRKQLNDRLKADLIHDIYFVVDDRVEPPRTVPAQPAVANVAPAFTVPPLRDPRLSSVFERIARAHARCTRE